MKRTQGDNATKSMADMKYYSIKLKTKIDKPMLFLSGHVFIILLSQNSTLLKIQEWKHEK